MLKKLGLRIVAVFIILGLTNLYTSAQTRVKFKPGSDSAVVSGNLGQDASRVFTVGGKAGQKITISVKAVNKKTFVYPEADEMGEWGSGFSQTLEADGDFRFVLDNQGKATAFTLTVTLK